LTIGSDRLEGMNDLDEADAGWVGETGTRSDTDTPQVGKYEIPVHEMYAMPRATQKLLDDAAIDVEAWLAGKVADKLARTENAAFVTGNGVSKPRGFTAYTTAATADGSRTWGQLEHVLSGASGDFAAADPADKLFDVEAAMKPALLAGARWVTRRSVIAKVRKFKSTDDQYLWQPGLQAGAPASLIGYPITLAEDMPALAEDSLSMALGNFAEGYQIVDRLGVRVLRDPFTAKPYVRFYTTKRTGGAVVNFDAIKFLKFNS
jgi:HK97 family phage major capsid protein